MTRSAALRLPWAAPRRLLLLLMAVTMLAAGPAQARSILFVGNSFTYGGFSAAAKFRAASVDNLNGNGLSGMPAIFKAFADQKKLDYRVSLEVSGGRDLRWHWDQRRALLDRSWDEVVLQDYSTLDPARPGDPAGLIRYAGRFAELFRKRNPEAKLHLLATWSRPDLTYLPKGAWFGKGIFAMAADLRAAYDRAAAEARIGSVIPVGEAFNLAMLEGVADPNPYDGIAYGQVDLWTYDHYHASVVGCYLEALVVFAHVTGEDPRTLGKGEVAAQELGISPAVAERLQAIAWKIGEARR